MTCFDSDRLLEGSRVLANYASKKVVRLRRNQDDLTGASIEFKMIAGSVIVTLTVGSGITNTQNTAKQQEFEIIISPENKAALLNDSTEEVVVSWELSVTIGSVQTAGDDDTASTGTFVILPPSTTLDVTPTAPALGLSQIPSGSVVLLLGSGQSNEDGITQTGFTDPGFNLTSKTWFRDTPNTANGAAFVRDYDSDSWQTMEFGVNINAPINASQDRPNPALYLANALESAYPSLEFRFLRYATGGDGFENGSGDFGDANTSENSTRRVFFERYLMRALPELLTEARGKQIYCAMYFVHGEQDAQNSTWASAYTTQAANFFDEINSYFDLSIPKHITRLNDSANTGTLPFRDTVISQQNTLNNRSDTTVISIDGIAMAADSVHYPAAGYQSIANLIKTSLEAVPLVRLV